MGPEQRCWWTGLLGIGEARDLPGDDLRIFCQLRCWLEGERKGERTASPYMTCDGQDASLRDWQVGGHLVLDGGAAGDASHLQNFRQDFRGAVRIIGSDLKWAAGRAMRSYGMAEQEMDIRVQMSDGGRILSWTNFMCHRREISTGPKPALEPHLEKNAPQSQRDDPTLL